MVLAMLEGVLNLSLRCGKVHAKKALGQCAAMQSSLISDCAVVRPSGRGQLPALLRPSYLGSFVLPQRSPAQPDEKKFQSSSFHQSVQANVRTKVPWEYSRNKKPPPEFNSGDKAGLTDNIDLTACLYRYQDCKELETADENVKKIVSLQFATGMRRYKEVKWMNIRRLRKHVLDRGSFETQITAMTFAIRHWQLHMKKKPKDVKKKVILCELIDRRLKFLKHLRKKDIFRFEWLLKELNLEYKPVINYCPNETKKGWLRDMTHMYCEKIRKSKIKAFRDKLQEEQVAFLKEKEEKLKFMAEEVKALGLTEEEKATVQYVDIADIQRGPPPVAASLQRIALTSEGYLDSPIPPYRKYPKI